MFFGSKLTFGFSGLVCGSNYFSGSSLYFLASGRVRAGNSRPVYKFALIDYLAGSSRHLKINPALIVYVTYYLIAVEHRLLNILCNWLFGCSIFKNELCGLLLIYFALIPFILHFNKLRDLLERFLRFFEIISVFYFFALEIYYENILVYNIWNCLEIVADKHW